MEGVPLPPGIPGLGGSADPLEAILGTFPCVRLKNLPFDATLEDILVLFQGLIALDVLTVGQGEAFVLISNPMDFQMALQRDGQTIGRRYVEVTQGTRNDYYEAIATKEMMEKQPLKARALDGGVQPTGHAGSQQMPSDSSNMWGSTTQTQVQGLGFFQQTRGESGDHQHQQNINQGGAGHAGHGHGHGDPTNMGGRGGHIGMMPGMGMGPGGVGGPQGAGLGPNIMPGVGPRGQPVNPNSKRTGGGIQIGDHTGFLRMRGLPFSSTKDDIFKFFDSYNPVPDSIVLTYRSDGRATGESYVGFASPDDSKRAMDLHRKSMGSRYIELFISNKEEHGRSLQRFGNR